MKLCVGGWPPKQPAFFEATQEQKDKFAAYQREARQRLARLQRARKARGLPYPDSCFELSAAGDMKWRRENGVSFFARLEPTTQRTTHAP